ncbi:Transmembrane protein of unknown function (DUF3566) [Promicromonospora umidemergens]|uniref:DUF3566 domain-containing protein n=1 Tax=Promicromonospora umidemergens TaxID=629679 RepID=A0ABP8XQP7_9MICO|nr:DUF3566 domain-containing protein [Promicromonospora umidemergens]MCP2285384.1 Transmembrane protein of unknown function (DUF3566) [Promicromonospora umidemergens]
MTSDKSGPVSTASPALEEDLETTRVRKDVTGEQAPAEAPGTAQPGASAGSPAPTADAAASGAASNGAAGAGQNTDLVSGPVVVPAPPASPAAARPSTSGPSVPRAEAPVPPAPEESGSAIPTTGGVWRSAYEAGRSDTEAKPAPQSAAVPDPDVTAKSWNRVPTPGAPPAPPTGAAEGTDGVRAGAMKAAQAALDAARSAAKKVTSIMPDDQARTAAPANDPKARPEMHYTAAGVRGTATSADAQAAAAAAPQAPAQPASAPTPETARPAPAGPRRVRLAISRVDPWSVMKLAFLLAVAIAIMTVVATAVFWSVLNSFGVFTTVQEFVVDAVGPQSDVNLTQFVEFPRVISLATLISICNIVLLTAIATIMAFLYNITAALVGGVHMTLTDD